MRVGIFGSKYQVEKQSQIKRLFEKLISQEAEIYVDVRFYNFLTDILNYEPPVAGLLTDDNFDLDVALSVGGDGTFLRTAARVNRQDIPILGINTGRLGFLADVGGNDIELQFRVCLCQLLCSSCIFIPIHIITRTNTRIIVTNRQINLF